MQENHIVAKNDENREIIEAISDYVSYCKVRCFQCCKPSCAGMGRKAEITGNKCSAPVHSSLTSTMATGAGVMCVQCPGGRATEPSLKALNELECSWTGVF